MHQQRKARTMQAKHTTPNGSTYTIRTYTIGMNYGTGATVRRGGWSASVEAPHGMHGAAIERAAAVADAHAARQVTR